MPRQHDEAEEGSRSNGGVCCNGVEHYNLTVPSTTTMPRPTGLTRTTTMPSPTGPEAAKTVPSSMVPASTGYEFLVRIQDSEGQVCRQLLQRQPL